MADPVASGDDKPRIEGVGSGGCERVWSRGTSGRASVRGEEDARAGRPAAHHGELHARGERTRGSSLRARLGVPARGSWPGSQIRSSDAGTFLDV